MSVNGIAQADPIIQPIHDHPGRRERIKGALLVTWLYFGGVSMAALFVSLAPGLSTPYAQAGANDGRHRAVGSASGVVVFSPLFWPAVEQLTGLLAGWDPRADRGGALRPQ